MAATVKPIEAKAIHQIQSGQVIVDLCSVVKELVENSLDAEANTIEVRFKNNGLDEIEVQDNGSGIAAVNYENLALKHYTSKLSTYDDLSSLSTFGFRGEALSSLCALSSFTVSTAQAHEAPKGNRLEFEVSGKLKSTSVVACQKGTIATVSNLFQSLPVRRKELSKNIKREYGKVLGLLHAYACVSTGVKFTVKNAMPKGTGMVVFATKSNTTTRENIANVYGAKTLSALVPLNLSLELQSEAGQSGNHGSTGMKVTVTGHISKPVFGEGRQTPDRQMFFVNGRPCGLPQIAKAINEVYKSFNVSQSPFIFADFQLDTNAYDVNVSPDKRSIFLHNAVMLTDALKTELTNMFDDQAQTVPQSQIQTPKLPGFKQLNIQRTESTDSAKSSFLRFGNDADTGQCGSPVSPTAARRQPDDLQHHHFRGFSSTQEESSNNLEQDTDKGHMIRKRKAEEAVNAIAQRVCAANGIDEFDNVRELSESAGLGKSQTRDEEDEEEHVHVKDFNARMAEQGQYPRAEQMSRSDSQSNREAPIPAIQPFTKVASPGAVQDAFDRMRPRRLEPDVATITIGDKTITKVIGSQQIGDASHRHDTNADRAKRLQSKSNTNPIVQQFSQRIGQFAAPGAQARADLERIEDDDDGDGAASLVGSDSEAESEHDGGDEPDGVSHRTPKLKRTPNRYASRNELDFRLDPAEDDEAKKEEEDRVRELIALAEIAASKTDKEVHKRATQALKGGRSREATTSMQLNLDLSVDDIIHLAQTWQDTKFTQNHSEQSPNDDSGVAGTDEERLSLTVAKSDFAGMHIVGQFNLGFILAVRRRESDMLDKKTRDELFIIDQHASDEKYNFERLQAETVVGNQRMVRPVTLDLTAVEEEVLLSNSEALEKNGFIVQVDTSGDKAVGQRCQLVSLPLSKEVAFNTRDLDELIHLLNESPMLTESNFVPRPSKVRKMFAMRACRSSIMIGKTLSKRQMSAVLQHMGSIDKPWNCPHGRPTMRHLASLDVLDSSLWLEGNDSYPGEAPVSGGSKSVTSDVWREFAG